MTDTLENIMCPACGKMMHKIYIKENDLFLDVCLDGCGGIYFDNREFNKFDEKHENAKELFEAIDNKTFEPVDESEVRYCPVCKAKMVKNYSSIKQEIQVDDCYNCGGKFLDAKELEKIRAEYENDFMRARDVDRYVESKIGAELEQARINGALAKMDKTNSDRLIDVVSLVRGLLK